MGFHATQRRALQALEDLKTSHPELAERARDFEQHYLHGGLEKPSAHMLHAAVCLLREKDYAHAASALSSEAQVHILQAEKHVIDAVNNGPESLKNDEEYLHAKGIMRGSKRYFLGFKHIELGSVYDISWRTMDQAYRPIIAAAIQGSMNKNDKVISKKVMQYVAACLMPEDDAKYLQLNKLSLKYEREHGHHLKDAAEFIRQTAKALNIRVPETMLGGALTPKSQRADAALQAPSAEPVQKISKPAIQAAPAETALRKDFRTSPALSPVAGPRPPANDQLRAAPVANEAVLLKRRLETLERRGEISPKSARGYFWLQGGTEYEPRSHADLAEKIGKSERQVMFMMVGVKVKLKALEAEEAGKTSAPSNGNLHQARAVRPE